MYAVYENGKPAILPDSDVWNKYQFDTFDEAREYAINWLGMYGSPDLPLELNKPYDYGYGVVIEIRREY